MSKYSERFSCITFKRTNEMGLPGQKQGETGTLNFIVYTRTTERYKPKWFMTPLIRYLANKGNEIIFLALNCRPYVMQDRRRFFFRFNSPSFCFRPQIVSQYLPKRIIYPVYYSSRLEVGCLLLSLCHRHKHINFSSFVIAKGTYVSTYTSGWFTVKCSTYVSLKIAWHTVIKI